ncbi:hypothetical protein BWI97_18320 [Siphonobacter sp. BAB-5405]|uniref:DUF3800 domain-containing protein n=1 Tax=Siphonobacter sp. BAB-5405 TaxID=1864825 RepID=UPI000C80D0BC|nr:DUF3800 domain-containing protein [Siphonobacter sp. BAB-5405]PMD93548.1 hypothetical protein BWI97_18320 [Siphonobacter sp. BAB-5405]
MEYFIWCDESEKKGKHFSNFYGGVLVESTHLSEVELRLKQVCEEQALYSEIKWQKVTEHYLDKYKAIVGVFFDLMKEGKVKMRVMFTQNFYKPLNLTHRQIEEEFFILYYHFFKHAFGLPYSNKTGEPIYIRAYFDYLPDKIERTKQFKEFIKGLEKTRDFKAAQIKIRKSDIAEIDSKAHRPLQFMDVILGAMAFRLNDKHLEKPVGSWKRGKRTIAKEKLYKYINLRIRDLHTGFNVGANTGMNNGMTSLWEDPYRHWLFIPKEHEKDNSQIKTKK